MRRVAIIGSNQSLHEPRKAGTNVETMIYETVRGLLDRTGIDIKDVENVIGAGDDVLDGRSISNVFTAEYAGAFLKEESKVEDDGAFAAAYAFMRIASGAFDTALVYAYSRSSDSSPEYYSGMTADPFYLRSVGIESITAAALQAMCYFQKHGATEEDAARVAAKNSRRALKNPYVKIKRELSIEEVMASPLLATPIKELDAPPTTDGCCAILLASEDAARRFDLKPAWIRGLSFCADAYYPGHRDLARSQSARIASERAYRMAGVVNPLREIQSAEIHAPFSYQEMILCEALGLCEEGKGRELIGNPFEGGSFNDKYPVVNISSGAMAANPIFAAGLVRLAEAASHVTGQAATYGIEAKTALAHAMSGFCLQSNIVYVMGDE